MKKTGKLINLLAPIRLLRYLKANELFLNNFGCKFGTFSSS